VANEKEALLAFVKQKTEKKRTVRTI
jgi:hypothetical protein